jgi:predicted ribosomally synthesized peptide with SipW-like signal peptide
MKKITLSLLTIAAVVVMVVGVSQAYFTDGKVIDGNTYATGEVTLGDVSPMKLTVLGLTPGKTITKTMNFQYVGSERADVYLGNRHENPGGVNNSDTELRKLRVKIWNSEGTHFDDYAYKLAESWYPIANNMKDGTKYYTIEFTLDADAGNEYQGVHNNGTVILLYAIQAGAPGPTSIPYSTRGSDPEAW